MKPAHRSFLLVHQGIVPALFNLVLNGAIAWALFRKASEVPLWGESSVGVDLIATAAILPFATALIVSRIVAGQVRSGRLEPLAGEHLPAHGLSHRPAVVRGAWLALAALVFAAFPVVLALELGHARPFAVAAFVGFKAVWAALLAAAVSPLIGWWALAHASRAARAD